MSDRIGATEARLALEAIESRRREVADRIDVPGWYWPFLAAGWIGLGAIGDFGPAWATTAATIAFGVVHSTLAGRALSGRHGSSRLSVRADLITRGIAPHVIGLLLTMVVLTIAFGFGLSADGARHPGLDAGIVVGLLVLAAGPVLMGRLRADARRSA